MNFRCIKQLYICMYECALGANTEWLNKRHGRELGPQTHQLRSLKPFQLRPFSDLRQEIAPGSVPTKVARIAKRRPSEKAEHSKPKFVCAKHSLSLSLPPVSLGASLFLSQYTTKSNPTMSFGFTPFFVFLIGLVSLLVPRQWAMGQSLVGQVNLKIEITCNFFS